MDSYKKIIAGIAGIFIGAAQIISVNAATDDVSVQTDVPVVQVSNLQYSYDQMKQDLETLQEKYPEQMQIESLGTTADGREILEAVLGDVNAEHHIQKNGATMKPDGVNYIRKSVFMSFQW